MNDGECIKSFLVAPHIHSDRKRLALFQLHIPLPCERPILCQYFHLPPTSQRLFFLPSQTMEQRAKPAIDFHRVPQFFPRLGFRHAYRSSFGVGTADTFS